MNDILQSASLQTPYLSAVCVSTVIGWLLGFHALLWLNGSITTEYRAITLVLFTSLLASVATFAYCIDLDGRKYGREQFWDMLIVTVLLGEVARRMVRQPGEIHSGC